MQHVLFSWLVVGELREDPRWVGAAQMCAFLPATVFVLVGGVVADRVDRRRVLAVVHSAAALLCIAMASIVNAGQLRLGIVFAYALVWGSFQSFVLPARDSILSDVAGDDLARAVTGVTIAQFVAQAVGSRGAGFASTFGSATLLGVQGLVLVSGLLPLAHLAVTRTAAASAPAPGREARGTVRDTLHEIREGLRVVRSSPRLRVLTVLIAANGFFFMGPYFVVCPLIVRDVYHGDVADLSWMMLSFPIGTILGSLWVLQRGGIRHKGRALLLGLASGALFLVSLAAPLPFLAFLGAIFGWGLCGAVFLNMSRTLFQAAAPAAMRARVLAVYSLAMIGMAPPSAFVSGLLAEAVGPSTACAVFGAAMLVVITIVWLRSDARAYE
jgi:MFS family permease